MNRTFLMKKHTAEDAKDALKSADTTLHHKDHRVQNRVHRGFTAFLLTLILAACGTANYAQQAQPSKQIPIPPLHPFHPEQPKRIELKNGLVILLEEDHELPFINRFIDMRGGSRDEP